MDYREKVAAYASVLMGHAPDMDLVFDTLHEKIMYSTGGQESLDFWTEVSGRVHRNSLVKEIMEMEHIERYNAGLLEKFPDIETLLNSPNVLKWIKYLEPLEDEIIWLMDYQKDNGVREKPSEQQCIDSTVHSLKFFNDALDQDLPMQELFRYIPLMVWSIDNLLASDQLHPSFHDFLLTSFVPVLRAHKAATKIFLDLLKNEEKYLDEEEKSKIGLTQSAIFDRKYEAKSIPLPVPETYEDPKSDPYICSMSYTLMQLPHEDIKMLPRAENVRRAWHFTPLTNLYRLKLHSTLLGVYDEYVPVVRPKILTNMYNVTYNHIKSYSEENLIASNLLVIQDIISESSRSEYKDLYKYNFMEMLRIVEMHSEEMIVKGLVTAQASIQSIKELKETAREYGLLD